MGLQTEHNLLYYTTLEHCSIAQLVERSPVKRRVPWFESRWNSEQKRYSCSQLVVEPP